MTADADLSCLGRVWEAIAENLAAVDHINGTPMFGGNGFPTAWESGTPRARIYFAGDVVPDGGPEFPIAIIRPRDEDRDEQTTVRRHFLPWELTVIFRNHADDEPDGYPNRRHQHANLVKQIKDRFDDADHTTSNRQLPLSGFGNTAEDTTYEGGGAALTPLDEDAEHTDGPPKGSARFAFTMQFETVYRHAPGDSNQPA